MGLEPDTCLNLRANESNLIKMAHVIITGLEHEAAIFASVKRINRLFEKSSSETKAEGNTSKEIENDENYVPIEIPVLLDKMVPKPKNQL